MKILIISDSHGRNNIMDKVIEQEAPLDLIIHLGDLEGGEDFLEAIAPCPVEMVCGNNDFFTPYPREKIIDIGRYRALLCHGHHYCVSTGTDRLVQMARQQGCNLVMFGHTHRPVIEPDGDVTVINPGSISYPRQENHQPSYIIMHINDRGKTSFNLKYMEW